MFDLRLRMFIFIFLIAVCRPMEVPVAKFVGFNSTAENVDSKRLTWVIEPWNAALFWIRCYREVVADGTHFFTYDHNREQIWKGGALENRTVTHSFKTTSENPIRFSLTIEHLRKSDAGKYICELDSYGASTPHIASLHLHVISQKTEEEGSKYTTQVSTDQSQSVPWTTNYTGQLNEGNAEIQPILSLIMIVTIPSVAVLLSFWLTWKLCHRSTPKPSRRSVGNPDDGIMEAFQEHFLVDEKRKRVSDVSVLD